ncbi:MULTISPECIES: ABC transporter substrate-binding protein [unclassified Nocardioides]|uniref:ABC transporter substrate-binding protein n=1 Tax=unclassified Nocardioides TaxID=2615069 RepID=UPI0009F063E1|nr:MULTISPECIES: ABC transporter substrate-binding protein [unclassified Nocardioides]GAW52392.1 hypothetical protein PD653B2_4747 [Nocardioides sp. PD653-B2]GAW53938.1 hypothetical protein PD653_1342 [Nocardioides sp. PD653]
MSQRSRLSRRLSAVAVMGLVGTLAACGNLGGDDTESGGDGSSSGELVIAVLVDQTAYTKTLDGQLLAGAEAAVAQINEDGGVDGKDLKLEVRDTAADPQRGVQGFQRLDASSPAAFIGGFSSAVTAAVAPIASTSKAPYVVASILPEDGADYAFSTIIPVNFETATRVEYLQEQGIERVAVMHDPTPYNLLQLEYLEEQLADAGITLTGAAEHATDAVDLRAQVTGLLADDPQALIKLSAGPTQIIAARALEDAGSDIPMILGLDSEASLQQTAEVYDAVFDVAAPLQVFESLPEDERNDAMRTFMSVDAGITDPNYAGRGWDAIFLAVQALEEAGSTDGEDVRQALIDLGPYEGTTATYDYTEDDHNGMASNPNYMARIHADGTAEAVFSPQR